MRKYIKKIAYRMLDIKKLVVYITNLKADRLSIPPPQLMDKVRKGATRGIDFIYEGLQAKKAIIALSNGFLKNEDKTTVLDFGCGCGRIARHFYDYKNIALFGTDVDDSLIAFCKTNMPKFSFTKNEYYPPLTFENNKFDFIYSISVFTHLTKDAQIIWFRELHRVIKVTGILIISIILDESEQQKEIQVNDRFDQNIKRDWLGKNNAPKVYCTTNHKIGFFYNKISHLFKVQDINKKSIRGKQTLIKLKPIK